MNGSESLLVEGARRVGKSTIVQEFAKDEYESFLMIINECRRTDDPNIAPALNASETYVKCYMCDTGLLLNHAFNENEILENEVYKQILTDKLSLNEGEPDRTDDYHVRP